MNSKQKVLLRVNEIQISKSDLKMLNQKITRGEFLKYGHEEKRISLFQYYMWEKGFHIDKHEDWKLIDGYYQFCFTCSSSMNLLRHLKNFLREYLQDKRIHVYMTRGRKGQYYQMVPKGDEFLELEVGYSMKFKGPLITKLKEDIKKCSDFLNRDDIDEVFGGDGYPTPLFHTKVIRRPIIMDECFGFGEDEDNPTVIHQRDKDVYRDSPEEWGLKQYSFFANVFNYKESMLLDSLRILKKGMWS